MTPLAHVGHWYEALFYLVPIAAVVVALWLSRRRERRDTQRSEGEDESVR